MHATRNLAPRGARAFERFWKEAVIPGNTIFPNLLPRCDSVGAARRAALKGKTIC
jgi:hypothetical protein